MSRMYKQYGNVIVIEDSLQNQAAYREEACNPWRDEANEDFIYFKSRSNTLEIKNTAKRLAEEHKRNIENMRDEGQLLDYFNLVNT